MRLPSHLWYQIVKLLVGQNCAIMAGNCNSVIAKMMGMTPALLIFMGMWLLWPPYIFAAHHALGVLDGDLALTAVDEHHARKQRHHDDDQRHQPQKVTSPLKMLCIRLTHDTGKRDTMPMKMISEMPLPIPLSEIFSAIHITIMEPATSEQTTVAIDRKLKFNMALMENTMPMLISVDRPTRRSA